MTTAVNCATQTWSYKAVGPFRAIVTVNADVTDHIQLASRHRFSLHDTPQDFTVTRIAWDDGITTMSAYGGTDGTTVQDEDVGRELVASLSFICPLVPAPAQEATA